MDTLKLDPAAMAAYTRIADAVSAQLTSAAEVAGGAVAPERLAVDLGLVGAQFAQRFTAAVTEHQQALSTAGRLVGAYGDVLRGHTTEMGDSDSETAAALARTKETLA
ncbi:hypothetical protein D5S18_29275 [Nocardia panacis]|uniref:Uncharacterized protein n=1 Tax=Nocardia panacis TaxID=2340916 RepID=A0A3A4KBH0_9NOCA|nr:hypothetical protein [Nocardia panacis]RJO69968.1 hypothetical protein D5S18_29275 [Nocardia panacis]